MTKQNRQKDAPLTSLTRVGLSALPRSKQKSRGTTVRGMFYEVCSELQAGALEKRVMGAAQET